MKIEDYFAVVTCPWCKRSGFDLEGLKIHITTGECKQFNKTDVRIPKTRKSN